MILPVVGLLLLLGLFWYWASTLIGDDNNDPSNITPTVAIVIDSTQAPGVTATVASGITPTETSNQPDAETPTTAAGTDETPTEEATESSGAAVSTAFAIDDAVTTNDSVNMRSDADATADNVIVTLDAGTELVVIGDAVEGPNADGDDIIWWEVRDEATGDEGWVAEDFLDAAS